METADRQRAHRRRLFDATCMAVLIVYFLHFALPALRGGFREDEMMNMGIYWKAGALKSVLANIVFWKLFYVPAGALYDLPLYLYRPGGALYYLPLYHFFDLDPLPYRFVQIAVLAVSIPLVYYLSWRLASSRSVAFLAVLALCYHPRLSGLVFVGAFIYDVLCGFFYFAALAYYIHNRKKEHPLRSLQLLGFLVLYICALNCKEMAVTLPVIVLIYEVLKSWPWGNWKALSHWIWFDARPSLIAGLLTLLYIYGKTYSSGSLTNLDPYRPRYSWHNFATSNARFVGELLFLGDTITPTTLLILWAVVFTYAFIRRDRTLQLMAFWIVIVPLPLAFIVPVRGNASLYILLFGWAMIFAKVVFDLITVISKLSLAVSARLHPATGTSVSLASRSRSPRLFRIIAALFVAFAFATFIQRENQRLKAASLDAGAKTLSDIQTFRSLGLHPTSGSRIIVLFKEHLFYNKWHAFFIASLVWNDHSLRIWVEKPDELTPQQQANADYIISLDEFSGEVIRSPELPTSN